MSEVSLSSPPMILALILIAGGVIGSGLYGVKKLNTNQFMEGKGGTRRNRNMSRHK